jgi:hypothetical protein
MSDRLHATPTKLYFSEVPDGSKEIAQQAEVTAEIAAAIALVDGISLISNSEARTATADGLTTGIISDTTDWVTVTSANADHIITLPTPTPGRVVRMRNTGGSGFELRSSAPATVAINGGTGAAAESAIAANSLVQCVCCTATQWNCTDTIPNGTVAATQVAAP